MKLKLIYLLLAGAVVAPAASAITLTPEECRALALSSDERTAIAANDVAGADLDRQVAKTAYLPNFAGTATGIYSFPDGGTPAGDMTMRMRGVYMAGINLQQPIYAGGKIMAANRLAKIGQRTSLIKQRQTRSEIIADADNAYWSYVAVIAKVNMARAYLTQIDSMCAQARVSLEAGMSTRNDLLRIEARQSQVHYQLEQATTGADLCRMALCRTIGVPFDTPIDVTDPAELPRIAAMGDYDLTQRPEMQLLSENIAAKEQQLKVTRADFLPTVGLQFGWSAYGNAKIKGVADMGDGTRQPYTQEIKGNSWMGLLSVSVPLFHWGEGMKKVKRARVDIANAQLERERNARLMQLEVQQAIANVTTGASLVQTAQTGVDQATESLRNMNDRYQAGMSTLTDMLDAQAQWQTALANLIEARAQYRINVTEYLRTTGQLAQ